jgi:hypothetical protein
MALLAETGKIHQNGVTLLAGARAVFLQTRIGSKRGVGGNHRRRRGKLRSAGFASDEIRSQQSYQSGRSHGQTESKSSFEKHGPDGCRLGLDALHHAGIKAGAWFYLGARSERLEQLRLLLERPQLIGAFGALSQVSLKIRILTLASQKILEAVPDLLMHDLFPQKRLLTLLRIDSSVSVQLFYHT